MPYGTDAIITSGIQGAEEAWKDDHDRAMECRDLESIIQSGLFLFNLYRTVDQNWSRQVMDGKRPFNSDMARGIHALYVRWMKPVPAVLNWLAKVEQDYEVEGAEEIRRTIRTVRKLAKDDIEAIVTAGEDIAGGRIVALEDDDAQSVPLAGG